MLLVAIQRTLYFPARDSIMSDFKNMKTLQERLHFSNNRSVLQEIGLSFCGVRVL